MEEIYIIKLKGLPSSSVESLRDNKASFYYSKDLTGEALLGFGVMHLLIGATLMTLSIINLLIDSDLAKQMGAGVWCGAIFAMAGLMGIVTSHKRKRDISKSKIQVKIYFALSIVTILLTATYFILMIFGMRESSANTFISSNIMLSFLSELFISLLSIFTCIRVIWPGSLSCCAKDWPGHPKLKRKVIVATQIYTNGVKQDEDLIRSLGPNCVISLSAPQTSTKDCDNYTMESDCNNFGSLCPCCDTDYNQTSSDTNYQSSACHHNSRSSSSPTCDNHEQYDSDFDSAEQFDTTLDEHNIYERIEGQQDMAIIIEENGYQCSDDRHYEVICHNNSIANTCQHNTSFDEETIDQKYVTYIEHDEQENREEDVEEEYNNSDNEQKKEESDKQFNYCTTECHKNCCEKSKQWQDLSNV